MNPIDKITDSTFTNSSKGLLTLFCIGLFHAVIGVDLTDARIAVPWFPTVNFMYIERLVYFYWGLIGYSVYRYSLFNIHVMRRYYFFALSKFFSTPKLGASFIAQYIFHETMEYNVTVDENGESPTIKIQYYGDVGSSRELMSTFDFVFSSDYKLEKIECSQHPDYVIEDAAFNNDSIRKSWGLTYFRDCYNNEAMTTNFIKSSSLRSKLIEPVLIIYLRIVFSKKEVFDLLMPIILNAMLFFYCILSNVLGRI
ncbi:hypothetical protein [Vibrio metschnikovii]|uniref:hypothetical protein n=1 Tax=Vibrio metschnikovii TaxID=28172 RepID=UPI002FC75669